MDAALDVAPRAPAAAPPGAFTVSARRTDHAEAGVPWGGVRAVSLNFLIFSFFFLSALAVFCASVRTFLFGFGFGFALAFFLGLGFALIRGLAFDFTVGFALGVVFLGAGFLAALVADVVGVLLEAAVVLPV